MNIVKTAEGSSLTLEICGRLDTNTAPVLDKELKDSLKGISDLTFNFENLNYISSAGLRVLLTAQKTMNKQGSMKMIRVQDEIMEIFTVTGFDSIMTIL